MVYWCAAREVEKYLESHPEPMSWRLLPPQEAQTDSTWQEKSIAQFNMLSPFPETHEEAVCKAYYEIRSSLEPHQARWGHPSDYLGDEQGTAPFQDVVRTKALNYLLQDARTQEEENTAKKLNDGILYLYHTGGTDPEGDGDFREAKLFVRIYPLHTLTTVEAAISYYFRARASSVCILLGKLDCLALIITTVRLLLHHSVPLPSA